MTQRQLLKSLVGRTIQKAVIEHCDCHGAEVVLYLDDGRDVRIDNEVSKNKKTVVVELLGNCCPYDR